MSKVASITIAAKSPARKASAPESQRDEKHSSSDSDEELNVRRRSSGSSSGYRRSPDKRQVKAYDEERGLINITRSGRMSSRQKSLEKELETEDPTLIASHEEARRTSSDDGLGDLIQRKSIDLTSEENLDSETFYMIKETSSTNGNGGDEESATNVYAKRNVDAPRKRSEGRGRRIESATGQLMDNYERDMSFDGELASSEDKVASFPPVSLLKQTYVASASRGKSEGRSKVELELDQIRRTFRGQGLMQNNDDDDDDDKGTAPEPEVLFRKPLSSIRDRFLAAASGNKMAAKDSDSDDDDSVDGDTTKKEEILPSPKHVRDMKQQWQRKGDFHENSKASPLDEINAAEVGLARNAFRQMEKKPANIPTVNRPIVHKVMDAKSLMLSRRHKTYGDSDEEVDGVINHSGKDELATIDIDHGQIIAAKQGFERMEEMKHEKRGFIQKPSMKLIHQEDIHATMNEHKRKVSEDDWAVEKAMEYSNGVNGTDDSHPVETNSEY
eukprot:gene6006-6704_t